MGFFIFVINSVALGVGLAMDAFSVSIANGLREPKMKARRMCTIAGVYAVFQYAMPVIGWFCVHTAAKRFEACQKFIPWIALLLLACIGGKMLKEGIENVRDKRRAEELEEEEAEHLLGEELRRRDDQGTGGQGQPADEEFRTPHRAQEPWPFDARRAQGLV